MYTGKYLLCLVSYTVFWYMFLINLTKMLNRLMTLREKNNAQNCNLVDGIHEHKDTLNFKLTELKKSLVSFYHFPPLDVTIYMVFCVAFLKGKSREN